MLTCDRVHKAYTKKRFYIVLVRLNLDHRLGYVVGVGIISMEMNCLELQLESCSHRKQLICPPPHMELS